MLTNLGIKNFKCFKETGDIEIRPLTFLVGPNSSGKSSILKALLMIKQTVDSTDFDNPLLANGKWTEVGTYPEFIYKGDISRNLEIIFEFTLNPDAKLGIPENIIESKDRKNKQKIQFRVVLYYNQKTTQIQLINSEIILNKTIRANI